MRTILIWYQSGGPFVVPLLIVGIAGLILLAERITNIVLLTRIKARPFMERIVSLARSDKVDEALKLCAEHNAALPDLGLVLLRSRSTDAAALRAMADAATLAVLPAITRRVSWLPAFALLAVMVGVVGAIANLHEVLIRAAGSGQGQLLEGIAYALRPLGAGIVIAIPLVAGYAYMREEARAVAMQLEEFSARLISAMTGGPDVRLGHRS